MIDHSDLVSFSVNFPDVGMLAAFGWFFWMRYQSLEKRFDAIEMRLIEARNGAALAKRTYESDKQMLEYRLSALEKQ